jgi:hypothetical protein
MMFGNVDLTTTNTSRQREEHSEGHHEMSCIHHTLQIMCNIFHIGLMVFGLFLFIYGIIISFHKPDPQKAMGSIVELYASALLLASIMGIFGTYRTSCRRIPLQISYKLVPVIVVLNVSIIIILIIEKHSFLRYLEEKKEELFLSSDDVQYIQLHFNLIYQILILCTLLEIGRFYLDRQLWKYCQVFDHDVRQEEIYRRSRDLEESRRRWNAERNGESIDEEGGSSSMTSPLLYKTNDTSRHDPNNEISMSNTSWWEDPEDSTVQDDMNVSSASWSLSKLLFHRKKQLEEESAPSTPLESSYNEIIQQDSDDNFADVTDEILYPNTDIPFHNSEPLQTSDASDCMRPNDNPQSPDPN